MITYFWIFFPMFPIQVLNVPEVRYVPIPVPVVMQAVTPQVEPGVRLPFVPTLNTSDFI